MAKKGQSDKKKQRQDESPISPPIGTPLSRDLYQGVPIVQGNWFGLDPLYKTRRQTFDAPKMYEAALDVDEWDQVRNFMCSPEECHYISYQKGALNNPWIMYMKAVADWWRKLPWQQRQSMTWDSVVDRASDLYKQAKENYAGAMEN